MKAIIYRIHCQSRKVQFYMRLLNHIDFGLMQQNQLITGSQFSVDHFRRNRLLV